MHQVNDSHSPLYAQINTFGRQISTNNMVHVIIIMDGWMFTAIDSLLGQHLSIL